MVQGAYIIYPNIEIVIFKRGTPPTKSESMKPEDR